MRSIILIATAALFFSCGSKKKLCADSVEQFYVSMETTPCFGRCPIYFMNMNSEGKAYLNNKMFVDLLGEFKGQASNADLSNIKLKTSAVQWDTLKEQYKTGYTDLPSVILRYSNVVGDTSEVVFETGAAPKELVALAESLDNFRKKTAWESINLD